MKTVVCFLLTSLLVSRSPIVSAQVNTTKLLVATDVLHGVGNALRLGNGVNARFQYPLTKTLAITGKVGIEYYRINYTYYVPGYVGPTFTYYAGNWGFYGVYDIPGSIYRQETTGLSMPITVGPRLFLPMLRDGLHVDLNVGADVGVSRTMRTSLHLSPGVGYVVPLPKGRSLDIIAHYVTALKRQTSIVGISVAYELPIKF